MLPCSTRSKHINNNNVKTIRYLRMDDEVPRAGVKQDLTICDEYLSERFTRLSPSGHDLTPLQSDYIATLSNSLGIEYINHFEGNLTIPLDLDQGFLGMGQKGIYVCVFGGLPLFSSGHRLDALSSCLYVCFTTPCDETHVDEDLNGCVRCVRSGVFLGQKVAPVTVSPDRSKVYMIQSKLLKFYGLSEKWPVESQPENYWGSEGQYRAWNRHEMSDKPLSY